MKDILDNPDKDWNWNYLSMNSNITMKDILDNPDKPWNWNYLSMNSNITIKDVKNNHDKPWNWNYLSCNKFKYDNSLQKIQCNTLKQITNIFHKYKRVYSHPSQDFWKWYCGDRGIGRSIDIMRSGCK